MIYYERAKDLLSNLDELDGLFHHDPSSISGKLRVDMPVGVARNLVMPRLPTFLHQYPGLELELSSSDRTVDLVREGFDCVVRVGTLKDSGLIARPVGKLTQINCASPQYLALWLSGKPGGFSFTCSGALLGQFGNACARFRSGDRKRHAMG